MRRNREVFKIRTGLGIDPLAMAETAADLVVQLLLNRERAARLVEHHARDSEQPSLMLDGVLICASNAELTWCRELTNEKDCKFRPKGLYVNLYT
jgi:hypothetical protein